MEIWECATGGARRLNEAASLV
ncbi:MAG: hypothetical protein JWN41_1597, partial [Thermoleophilia bacterium]|nr:hypothetical protein [Thermoleophilia bacterium]